MQRVELRLEVNELGDGAGNWVLVASVIRRFATHTKNIATRESDFENVSPTSQCCTEAIIRLILSCLTLFVFTVSRELFFPSWASLSV